ncbi:unnamed protein product, partial [Amoebophrya sp. A25]
ETWGEFCCVLATLLDPMGPNEKAMGSVNARASQCVVQLNALQPHLLQDESPRETGTNYENNH